MSDGSTKDPEVVKHTDSAAIVALDEHSQVSLIEQNPNAVGWTEIQTRPATDPHRRHRHRSQISFHDLAERGPRYPAVVRL